MNELLNADVKMTSLDIAEVTGKRHADVMRDVRKEIDELGHEISQRIFAQSTYTNERGRVYDCYEFGKAGAQQLALKYDAKTRYNVIQYVEQLENKNMAMSPTELALLQAQNLHGLEKRVDTHEQKLELIESKVENEITLSYGEQRRLQKAVARRVYEIYSNSEDRPKGFGGIYRDIKDRFGVASYKDIRRKDLFVAINYINAWIPRREAV